MAATALPRQIVLGPFTYRISAKAADWEQVGETLADSWGFTHHGSAVIMLNPTMPPALQRVALLHEMLHACAFAGGQLKDRERSEEEWVAMVAPMLIDCIRRSPGLADFLVAPCSDEIPIGQILDQLGVKADIEPDDLVSSVVVVLSVLVPDNDNPRLAIANSEGMTWIQQAGLLRLAERIVSQPPSEQP